MQNLELIKDISWEEVFLKWKKQESKLPKWIEHYKRHGFTSWDTWRESSTHDLHPEKLSWKLYVIPVPLDTVPDFI